MLRSSLSDRSLRRLLRAIDREQAAIEAAWGDPDESTEELQYRHDTLRELARAVANAGHARNCRVPQVDARAQGRLPTTRPERRRLDVRVMAA